MEYKKNEQSALGKKKQSEKKREKKPTKIEIINEFNIPAGRLQRPAAG